MSTYCTMTRAQALEHVRCAAAAGDMATATRLYVNYRIGRAAFNEAVAAGRRRAATVAARDAGTAEAPPEPRQVATPVGTADLLPGIDPAPDQRGDAIQTTPV